MYATIFKTKNVEEWNSIAKELLNVNKDDALKIFNYVFNEPYSHIDLDLVENNNYPDRDIILKQFMSFFNVILDNHLYKNNGKL